MSTRKSPRNHESSTEALMFEDQSLVRKYSVMDIAMLAAGCRGETRTERIDEAVELLSLVERYALAGKATRSSIRDLKMARESAKVKSSALQEQFQKAVGIRAAATRDKKTGKIELTSLVGLAYEGCKCCDSAPACWPVLSLALLPLMPQI